MKKFIYYEIAGFLPSSFISHELGNFPRYASRAKAIEVLEDVLNRWKEREGFACHGEFLSEKICDERYSDYRHQFVFKGKRTGMVSVETFRVVEHKICYNE